jgi:hypothetical protein
VGEADAQMAEAIKEKLKDHIKLEITMQREWMHEMFLAFENQTKE